VRERDWARGPARLASVLALGREDNGIDVCGPGAEPRLEEPWDVVDPARIRTGPRVGVSGPGGDATAYPWRFWLEGEPTVSLYRPGRR
jgi:DNA-3-methyladenine glycosylase